MRRLLTTSWMPSTKVLVAGTLGPAVSVALGLLAPRLPVPIVTAISSVTTAIIAYLTPAKS